MADYVDRVAQRLVAFSTGTMCVLCVWIVVRSLDAWASPSDGVLACCFTIGALLSGSITAGAIILLLRKDAK